ncbi:MAG TPA: hypothetical protein VJW20_14250 [Candidatus Angelobacter sp.]|nr:hypothetical protein [Candidatus Angelobacter sp.]
MAKVKDYYNALNQFGQLNISHETAIRQAFASLLDTCAKQFKWKLVQEFRIPAPKNRSIIVDGAVLDSFTLKHGFWEAKDLEGSLEKEIKKKLEQHSISLVPKNALDAVRTTLEHTNKTFT